jgi:DNA-binding transcriptional MerR regulator
MKKAPEAFRTISEVADLLDTPAHMLRFWESKFYQIRPVKRAGGRRYYRPDDVALINGIRILLQERGQTLRGVQRLLQEKGLRHVVEIGAALPDRPVRPRSEADLHPEDELAGDFAADDPPDPEAGPASEARDQTAAPVAAVPPPPPARKPPRPPLAPRLPETPAASPRAPVLAVRAPGVALSVPPAPPPALPAASSRSAPPPPPPPEPEPEALPLAAGPRLPQMLRALTREALAPRREHAAALARRIDQLIERMSEASGAGRW